MGNSALNRKGKDGIPKASAAVPNDLESVQRLFAKAVMRPLGKKERMQRSWDDGLLAEKVVQRIVTSNSRMSALERIEIYNRQYWFRIFDSMIDDFPAVRAVVGKQRFFKMVEAYISKYPSESYTLRNLGRKFEQFLCEHPEWGKPNPVLAVDCARLEWAQIEAFDAAAMDSVPAEVLPQVASGAVLLKMQPYIHLLDLSYPAHEFVRALRREMRERSEAASEDKDNSRIKRATRPKARPSYVVVHRLNNRVYFKEIEREAFLLLQHLASGLSLPQACEALLQTESEQQKGFSPENLVGNVQKWFTEWAALKWFWVGDLPHATV